MLGSARGVALLGGIVLAVAAFPWPGHASDEIFDARGFKANRPMSSQLPFEHIDPLNGNLLLVFTDLSLPGNGGFDLKIQRTYNSKIFRDEGFGAIDWDSWAGIGWSMHLGRVRTTWTDLPLAVEMPDGSTHRLFPDFVGGPAPGGDSTRFVTRDYWLYDRNTQNTPPTLVLTNGLVYTFNKVVSFGSGNYYRYPTRIEDAFGNKVEIEYDAVAQAPDAIKKITQYLGPPGNPGAQKREVTFSTEVVDGGARARLRTMTFLGRTWTFTSVASSEANKSRLTAVQPPVGRPWKYAYTASGTVLNELVALTTPNGGTITWTYGTQGGGSGALANHFYYGSSQPIRARVVTSRTTGGRDVASGTTTYKYAQGQAKNQSTITAPSSCSGPASAASTEFTFLGVGDGFATGAVWKIGLLAKREVKAPDGASLEIEELVWREPALNGNDKISPATEQIGPNTDTGIYAPVVEGTTMTRGGQTYITANTYRSQAYSALGPNFNDYGRPYRVVETGDAGTRTTDRTFDYAFTPYIKDRVATQTVRVGSESFARSWSYDDATGFATDEYGWGATPTGGIRVRYAATSTGNVDRVTDANDRATSFTYDWGVRRNVQTPAYPGVDTIRRTINADGTVQSETRRLNENGGAGYTTAYAYDSLARVKTVTPHVGAASTYDYDDSNPSLFSEFVKVTRGSTFSRESLDGYGRPSATANAMGVQTDTSTDACGFTSYESLPYDAQHPRDTTGFLYENDGLGRPTKRTNPGSPASTVSYRYSGVGLNGLDVEVTDEQGRKTIQELVAFGDLADSRVAAVTLGSGGAYGQRTAYSYNTLGSLTDVAGQGSRPRSLEYTARNELWQETHPESGQATYTYDPAGNLQTRADARGTTANYHHDANRRLTCIDQPPYSTTPCATLSADDTAFGFDRADNRTLLANSTVTSTFAYDGANRLTARGDTMAGPNGARQFTLGYAYDTLDNLQTLSYPAQSGLVLRYAYDNANRITDVRKNGAATAWASGFSYHPSGNPESFAQGSGASSTNQTYGPRHWLDISRAGTGTDSRKILSLDYGYDAAGNVTSIADDTTGRVNMLQTLVVDALDRLQSAKGPWGTSTYVINALGDRQSMTIANANGSATTTYSYDGTTGRLASLSGAQTDSFSYDNNGNLLSGGGVTYAYTLRNMVKTATAGGAVTTYAYDGDDQRALRVQGTTAKYFLRDPRGRLLSELEEACAGTVVPVRDYVYAGGRLIAAVKPVSGASVSFQAGTSSVSEAVALHNVTVVLTTASPSPCPVQVEFAMYSGTAEAGRDFVAVGGTVTFPPNAGNGATQVIPATILDDLLDEDDESFTLQLSGAGSSRQHLVTILDDDPTPLASSGPATTSVAEGNVGLAAVDLTVSLSAPSGRVVTASYATSAGTATSGLDYQAASATVTFPKETASQAVTVKVIGDTLSEEDETFTVSLTAATNATVTGSPAQVEISDDDVPRQPAGPPSDLDGDGDSDILWHRQTTGELYAWLLQGTVTEDGSYPTPDRMSDTSWQIRALADVDGDGDIDILWHRQTAGDLYVWIMQGLEVTTGAYLTPSSFADTTWQIRGMVDFDGDGDGDILWHRQTTGDLYVWLMTGLEATDGVYLEPRQFADTNWQIRGVADLNGDLQPDVLWHHQTTGDLYVWMLSGTTVVGGAYPSPAQMPDTNWKIRMVADFNGDHFPDFLWHHQTTGDLYVWFLDSSLVVTGGSYLTPSSFADTTWQIVPR